MEISRRTFVNLASAAVVTASTTAKVNAATKTPEDPLGIRNDFPLLKKVNYLNTAYHSIAPTPVVETGVQFYKDRANPADSIGPFLQEGRVVRAKFAKIVGAETGEIGLVHATTDAENIIANTIGLKEGDNVVTDDLQYNASFILYDYFAKTKGVEVRIVKRDNTGRSRLEDFEKLVDNKTKIVSVSFVSHENGFRHDLKSLSEIAHSNGAYFYVDAIQGIGMLDLNVKEAGIDFMGCGTYKWLLGSYGVAFFYIRKDIQDIITADRRGMFSVTDSEKLTGFDSYPDAARYGYATPAFGAISVINRALDYVTNVGITNISEHTVTLAQMMRENLVNSGIKTDTPEGNMSSIVTFYHGKNPEKVKALYEAENIKVTYKHGGTKIRVSASLFNNQNDIDHFNTVTAKITSLT